MSSVEYVRAGVMNAGEGMLISNGAFEFQNTMVRLDDRIATIVYK